MEVDEMINNNIIICITVDNDNYLLKKENKKYKFYINSTKFYEADEFIESKRILNEFLIKNNIRLTNLKMQTVIL
ncbi:MAG: hypothetical protein MR601_01080 [Erysipelotrichaceae bacterium]|nr:hypothetical protein [Erysipelotrichaceae bacterium]